MPPAASAWGDIFVGATSLQAPQEKPAKRKKQPKKQPEAETTRVRKKPKRAVAAAVVEEAPEDFDTESQDSTGSTGPDSRAGKKRVWRAMQAVQRKLEQIEKEGGVFVVALMNPVTKSVHVWGEPLAVADDLARKLAEKGNGRVGITTPRAGSRTSSRAVSPGSLPPLPTPIGSASNETEDEQTSFDVFMERVARA